MKKYFWPTLYYACYVSKRIYASTDFSQIRKYWHSDSKFLLYSLFIHFQHSFFFTEILKKNVLQPPISDLQRTRQKAIIIFIEIFLSKSLGRSLEQTNELFLFLFFFFFLKTHSWERDPFTQPVENFRLSWSCARDSEIKTREKENFLYRWQIRPAYLIIASFASLFYSNRQFYLCRAHVR